MKGKRCLKIFVDVCTFVHYFCKVLQVLPLYSFKGGKVCTGYPVEKLSFCYGLSKSMTYSFNLMNLFIVQQMSFFFIIKQVLLTFFNQMLQQFCFKINNQSIYYILFMRPNEGSESPSLALSFLSSH